MANKYSYRGTKIVGQSTAARVFKNSGISNAGKGQTYLNTAWGNVYSCVKSGKASVATWKYVRTDIVKKPTVAVSNLGAPVRQSGFVMKADWKTPAAMVNNKSGSRATALDIIWSIGIPGSDPNRVIKTDNERATTSSINLNSFVVGKKTYNRTSFYPFAGKPKLDYVTCRVVSRNEKGAGRSTQNTRWFGYPRTPTISDFTFNAESGELSCTIETNAGTDYNERYDTVYNMSVYYSNTEITSQISAGSTTSTSFTLTFDDSAYAARDYGDYAKVTVTAYARGFRGDSPIARKDFYIAYPSKATINSVDVSGKSSSDKCTVFISTNSTKEHPVDSVKLEYLANCDYPSEERIPGGADWQQTDIIDDAQCSAMALPVSDLIPEPGKYSWIRLKTFHANETVLHRYSDPVRVRQLETPVASAVDDKIQIVSALPGEDGKSAVIHIVWNDGTIESTGTELSWATEEDAWKSTKDPDDYTFEWSDGAETIEGVEWPDSATITIKGLSEGEKYYVKARRFSAGDQTTYSEYSNQVTVITSERPESVIATADRYVPRGSGLNVYWTFSANGLQTNWQIVKNDKTVIVEGEGAIGSTQISAERLESVADNGLLTFTVQVSTGSGFVVSEEKTVTLIDQPTLSVSTSEMMVRQPYEFVAIASVPSDLIVVVTSQGASGQFPDGVKRQTEGDTIYSDVISPEWIAGYARTTDVKYKDKRYFTKSGDVYELVVPESDAGQIDPTINPAAEGWYEEIDSISATVTLPPQLDFWDLGSYSVSVIAVDRQTRLKSSESVASFSVLWDHQAPTPETRETYTLSEDAVVYDSKNYYEYNSEEQTYTAVITDGSENPSEEGWYEVTATEYVILTPMNYVDEGGFHHQAVQIELLPPPNSNDTDVYDIYRMTPDGVQLIGQSFPLSQITVDEYAPFGEDMTNSYRIAVRTADGDVAFTDFPYVLQGTGLRLDWAEGSVEYPYGVSIGDSYTKDVDIRQHLNGSVGGYWNQGTKRKGTLNTDLIKIIQSADIERTRRLARYAGAVYVRTKEGTAFEADVQVTDLSLKNQAIMSVAIDANEIDTTEEFMLPTPFRLGSEGE